MSGCEKYFLEGLKCLGIDGNLLEAISDSYRTCFPRMEGFGSFSLKEWNKRNVKSVPEDNGNSDGTTKKDSEEKSAKENGKTADSKKSNEKSDDAPDEERDKKRELRRQMKEHKDSALTDPNFGGVPIKDRTYLYAKKMMKFPEGYKNSENEEYKDKEGTFEDLLLFVTDDENWNPEEYKWLDILSDSGKKNASKRHVIFAMRTDVAPGKDGKKVTVDDIKKTYTDLMSGKSIPFKMIEKTLKSGRVIESIDKDSLFRGFGHGDKKAPREANDIFFNDIPGSNKVVKKWQMYRDTIDPEEYDPEIYLSKMYNEYEPITDLKELDNFVLKSGDAPRYSHRIKKASEQNNDTKTNNETKSTGEKKYEFTDKTMEVDGHTLHRIKAIKKFGYIKVGDLGGWIESENNLSHDGKCWVYGPDNEETTEGSKVFDKAIVYGDASIVNNAKISGNAKIGGKAVVSRDVSKGNIKESVDSINPNKKNALFIESMINLGLDEAQLEAIVRIHNVMYPEMVIDEGVIGDIAKKAVKTVKTAAGTAAIAAALALGTPGNADASNLDNMPSSNDIAQIIKQNKDKEGVIWRSSPGDLVTYTIAMGKANDENSAIKNAMGSVNKGSNSAKVLNHFVTKDNTGTYKAYVFTATDVDNHVDASGSTERVSDQDQEGAKIFADQIKKLDGKHYAIGKAVSKDASVATAKASHDAATKVVTGVGKTGAHTGTAKIVNTSNIQDGSGNWVSYALAVAD